MFQVYDWQRDFGNDVTHEFAQVLDAEQHILHSSTDTGARSHVPAISLINFNFTNEKFDKVSRTRTTPDKWQSETLILSTNVDQICIETGISIVNGDK